MAESLQLIYHPVKAKLLMVRINHKSTAILQSSTPRIHQEASRKLFWILITQVEAQMFQRPEDNYQALIRPLIGLAIISMELVDQITLTLRDQVAQESKVAAAVKV